MKISKEMVAKLYFATFGRPLDTEGLHYWTNTGEFAVADKGTGLTTMEELSQSFSEQTEYTDLYPKGTDATTFVTAVYANLLGREPDAEGLEYWVDRLDGTNLSGTNPDLVVDARDSFILTFVNGAKDDANGKDLSTIDNRAEVALYLAETQNLSAEDAKNPKLIEQLMAITDTKITLPQSDNISKFVDVVEGKEFTLTRDTDTINGTENADTFNGVVATFKSTKTFEVDDVIDGGAGEDEAVLDLQGSFSGFTDGSMKNVETLTLNNSSTSARTFSMKNIEDVKHINIDAGDENLTISDIAKIATLDIKNADDGSKITLRYDTTLVEGSKDEMSVTLTDVGRAKTDTHTEKLLALNIEGIERLKLNSDATENFLDLSDTDTVALDIEGSGDLTLRAVNSELNSIDASLISGKLNLDLTKATEISSIKMGDKDDILKVANMASTITIDGGRGDDTLIITDVSDTSQPKISAIETLAFTDLDGEYTFAGDNVTNVTTVQIIDNLGDDLTLVNLSNSDLTIDLTDTKGGNSSDDQTVIYPNRGKLTVKTSTENDKNSIKSTNITADEVTELTIDVSKNAELKGEIEADSATSIEITNDTTPLTELKLKADLATLLSMESKSNITIDATTSLDKLESLELKVLGDVSFDAGSEIARLSSHIEIDATHSRGDITIETADYTAENGSLSYIGSNLGENNLTIGEGRTNITVKGGIQDDTITITEIINSNDEWVYNFDLGNVSNEDTVLFGDNSDITSTTISFKGVDKFGTIDATKKLTLEASIVSGESITSLNTGEVTLKGTEDADKIDFSDLTMSSSRVENNIIVPSEGDDKIKLSTTEAFTVVFEETATKNGVDTITNFTVGKDKIDLSEFATINRLVDITNATDALENGEVYYLFGQAEGTADTLLGTVTAINSGTGTITDSAYTGWLVISDNDSTTIYEWTGDNNNNEASGDTLTVVGTLDVALTSSDDIVI